MNEIVTPKLIRELKLLDKDSDIVYCIKRLNHYNGRVIKACGWYPDTVKRLFNKKTQTLIQIWCMTVITDKIRQISLIGSLKHYSFSNVSDLIQKMDKYTELYAEANIGKKLV